jgi:hypothetical protein
MVAQADNAKARKASRVFIAQARVVGTASQADATAFQAILAAIAQVGNLADAILAVGSWRLMNGVYGSGAEPKPGQAVRVK